MSGPRPGVVAEAFPSVLGWQSRAACRGEDPELWFAPDVETVPDRKAREKQARGICGGCPVRPACLRWAMKAGVEDGIWGGVEFGAYYGPFCRNRAHLMDAANTFINDHGSVKCRACRNLAEQRARARQHEGDVAA